nr:hypothetical transcript [Hymenolepis microstoma]
MRNNSRTCEEHNFSKTKAETSRPKPGRPINGQSQEDHELISNIEIRSYALEHSDRAAVLPNGLGSRCVGECRYLSSNQQSKAACTV